MIVHPLELSKRVCDNLIETFEPNELEPVNRPWFYAHGLFMCGLQCLYELTEDQRYLEYTKKWADSKIDENGEFYFKNSFIEGSDQPCFCPQLDAVQPGLPFFKLYRIYGDEKYKHAIEVLFDFLKNADKTSEGGYFHYWYKNLFPFQMWLDGLYMAEPFTMEYYLLTKKEECLDMIWNQFRLITEHTRDEKTGLLFHGWDETKEAAWADKETGHSSEFWGRSIGWYGVALADILEHFPKERPEYEKMKKMLLDVIEAVLKYQDESGLWYQVLDKGDREDNWLESSCTCLYLYTLSKCIRLGFLSKDYKNQADNAYRGILKMIKEDSGRILMENISKGLNVGDYEYYVGVKKSNSDLHGIGALVLGITEYAKIY